MMIASAVINQNAALHCHAIRSNSFLGLASSSPKKVKKVVYGINTAEPVHFIRLLDFKERSLKLKAAISDTDILKGTDLTSSLLHTEHPTILISENNDEGSKFSDEEVLSSVQLCTKEDVSQTVGRLAIVESLLDKLKAVQLHVLASERWNASQLKLCHRQYLVSATNLIHYLALRRLDVGQLKEDLSSIGLLNLENVDSCVLPSLTAIIQLLENLKSPGSKEVVHSDISSERESDQHTYKNFPVQTMRKKATSNKDVFFGPLSDGRTTHIMVTVGQEVTLNETSVADLIQAGASIVRINCAHGSPSVWSEIIRRVKESSQMLERPCRILMDLAGEKFRTGQLKPGPDVMKISPKKNDCGELIFPAQVWLSHKGAGSPPAHLSPDAILLVDDQKFLIGLEVGDNISFCDARGKMRSLKITRSFHVFSGTGYVAECTRTAYIKAGTELNKKRKKGRSLVGKVVDVPAAEPFVRLRVGDLLTISRDGSSNQDEFSQSTHSAQRITCSSGYLFDSVKPGERIAFDDGKIWGIIKGTSMSEIVVSITHASPKGTKLGSNKSINIPDSNVRFEGFTSKDLRDLEYVAAHADMVGVSFVRDVRDIVVLRQELEKRKLRDLGIVLKIETNSGFEKLPMMLLEAMKCSNPLCVMIARGDLAVECGWERLGDMQEEILSICGAAHVPVIWATQVLESLVKSGVPTRAEITDAACGRRASCVMLNKGKHVIEAVSTLNNILRADLKKMKPTN